MKKGFIIEGKTININLLMNMARKERISPEELSIRIGLGKSYLRNRRNENRKGIYREACSDIVEIIHGMFDISYDDLLLDMPKNCIEEGRTQT